MSSITLFFITVERKRMKAIIKNAPAIAPAMTDKKPPIVIADVAILPPIPNITNAAPRLEPELIPKIEASASGLLNAVCNINPEIESEAPVRIAVMVCGILDCRIMYVQLDFSESSPSKILVMAEAGISTEP